MSWGDPASFDLFKRELEQGHSWQSFPAMFFRLHGFDVEIPDLTITGPGLNYTHIKTSDIYVDGYPFEVKSLNKDFRDYQRPFVDTVSGWDAKDPKPQGVIFVVRPHGMMAWTPTWLSHTWTVQTATDRVRGFEESFYTVDVSNIWNLSNLVDALRRKRGS